MCTVEARRGMLDDASCSALNSLIAQVAQFISVSGQVCHEDDSNGEAADSDWAPFARLSPICPRWIEQRLDGASNRRMKREKKLSLWVAGCIWVHFLFFWITERLQNEGVLGSYYWYPMIWFQNPLNTNFQSSDIIKLIPRAPPLGIWL